MIGISCAATGDLRLVGGRTSDDASSQFGRLEVFNDGGWGTVCDRTGQGFGQNRGFPDFTSASVDVACQQLGFVVGAKTKVSVRFHFACVTLLPCSTTQAWEDCVVGG